MLWMWIGFIVFVLILLALDLGVFHRKAHDVSIKEALSWSVVWIALALAFNVWIYYAYNGHWLGLGKAADGSVMIDRVGEVPMNGTNAAIKFFTGYVIEKSLSVDNLFVMALIFAYFGIPNKYQHRVLFWGILGALIMRGIFIGLGAALIARFHWILYIFGAILIYTAWKMLFADSDPDPENNPLAKFARKHFPITRELHGQKLIIKRSELSADEAIEAPEAEAGPHTESPKGKSRYVLTPLALTLVVIEGTDLVFAVDSIPAIFAITADPFIVFTSNVFAILGLRALYFALAGILDKFYYLKTSLAIVLALVGLKMLTSEWLKKIEFFKKHLSLVTLGMIVLILGAGVVASIIRTKRQALGHIDPEPP